MPETDDLYAIIADQAETIDQLRAKLTAAERDGPYDWEKVYDDIRSAWDRWALVELGTSTPTPLDLEGKPELQVLWDSLS